MPTQMSTTGIQVLCMPTAIPLMIVVAIATFISKCFSRENIYFAGAEIFRNPNKDPLVSEDLDAHQETPVGELASRNLYTLSPQDSFRTLLKVLLHSPQEIFPVLDDNRKLVGVVQEKNLRAYLLDTKLYDILLVDDFMGAAPQALPYDATLAEATHFFDVTGADFIPVTKNQRYLGILTRANLLDSHRSLLNHQGLF